CLSLREARHLWRLRRTFFKVLKDKVVPLLALAERDWSVVRVFMDSGAFRYNLDSVFTEAVLDSDFEGLRMLAERTDGARTIPVLDARFVLYCGCVAIIMQQALRKGYVDKLSLLRSLRYDLDQVYVQLCLAKGGVAEQLLSEGSITVDFLGSRNSFRFSMLDLATTSYAEKKIHSLCKHRIYLYKVPFVLSSFLKAGAATNAFLQVDSCGYLLLLALAAESFNFVYLLVQEAVNLQEVLARYSSELLQMVSKDVSDEQTEGRLWVKRVLELHFQSQVFLDYAGELMSNKEFVQMRHLVEVHPFAFKAYFEENYKAMEDFETLDDGSSRQIALIVDLTSLHLPIAPFLESHQVHSSKGSVADVLCRKQHSWLVCVGLLHCTSMSKYGALSRSEGHSKWFLQKTLLEHDKSMDHPWMQMIYKQVFSLKQYASWLVLNRGLFKALEAKLDTEPICRVHDEGLLRTAALEADLRRLLGPNWEEESEKIASNSSALKQYLQSLEKDAENSNLLLAHHFLQYNAVLSGGAYLGKMVSEKLCVPHGAPGVKFYAFDGVAAGKESVRVQKYLQDFDQIEMGDEIRLPMLRAMKRIYAATETMMSEIFELNPVKGISYRSSQDTPAAEKAEPCAEQLELTLDELQGFQGQDGGRILIGIGGELLDVSSGRELYGPGGGYAILAGHDVTRCLATMSLEPDHLDDFEWKPDTPEDEEALKAWRERLKEKYPLAGPWGEKIGKLRAGEEVSADSGLRMRRPNSTKVDAPKVEMPTVPAQPVQPAQPEERCPISGKQGTCPMASIMGITKESTAAPSGASTSGGSTSFMKGKSLVASVQKKDLEDSLFYRLCPLHWDDKTIKMVAMIAVASWISGIFVGWNLRKMIAR
ncbi:Damage response protein 1, partial [Durusdinium trenchii]